MRKILLVDDDEDLSFLIEEALITAGYQVETAANGRLALAKLGDFTPDLILTDLSMPDMDGIELTKAIKSEKPDLPIVAMSAGLAGRETHGPDGDAMIRIAQKLGADRGISKPFRTSELLEVVADTLS